MFHYEQLHGDYALMDDRGEVQYSSPSIAIGYDPDNLVIHRHGTPEMVKAWAADARRKTGGFLDFAVIESDRWEIEDLNRILSTSGYLAVFLGRLKTAGQIR